MPDITLCPGQGCPLENRCLRFRAVAHGRQDYFGHLPYDAATGQCDSFWDLARLDPTEAQIRARAYHLWIAGGLRQGTADADWHRARAALDAETAAALGPVAEGACGSMQRPSPHENSGAGAAGKR